jgi:hypothetical protein
VAASHSIGLLLNYSERAVVDDLVHVCVGFLYVAICLYGLSPPSFFGMHVGNIFLWILLVVHSLVIIEMFKLCPKGGY